MKNPVINFIRYGCASKKDFDSVKEGREQFNFRVWRIVSALLSVYFTILFFSTFSVEVVRVNAVVDLVAAGISLFSFIMFLTFAKPGKPLLMPVVFMECGALFGFGILIGVVLSPEYLAVTFHVLLLGLPLVITDKPYKMCIMELISGAIYMVCCYVFKTGETRDLDVYNVIMFIVLGQFANYYMVWTKMSQLLAQRSIEISNMTDKLTGLNNRTAYEEDLIKNASFAGKKDLVYVSFDVNELKIVNDSLGHAAGDELLQGAAECIRRGFGAYGKTYRIGGDEFVAVIFADDNHLQEIKKDFESIMINWVGSQLDQISISVGYASFMEFPDKSLTEIAKIADERMYEQKEKHYHQKGIDRRGQSVAYAALCELYTKILKINITEDNFQIISMDMNEKSESMGFSEKISEWLKGFGESGQVHEADKKEYLEKTSLAYMSQYFKDDKNLLSVFYRRKIEGAFKQVVMEIIRANDYSDENQTLFLYVKNIDR